MNFIIYRQFIFRTHLSTNVVIKRLNHIINHNSISKITPSSPHSVLLNSSSLTRYLSSNRQTVLKYQISFVVKRCLSNDKKQSNADFEQSFKSYDKKTKNHRANIGYYMMSMAVLMIGLTYASVPLYKIFCERTGFDGIVRSNQDAEFISNNVRKLKDRFKKENPILRIHFESTPSSLLPWTFRPEQSEIYLQPGETALAFYRAKNESNRPIIGIATYNVQPSQAAFYFNKIQCFCFEEQRLEADEEVDMPVFFYIDPDYIQDPGLQGQHDITLSYTFFESKGTEHLAASASNYQKLIPSQSLPYSHREKSDISQVPGSTLVGIS